MNVHEVVARTLGDGQGRVVYVDNEHVAAAHAQLILEEADADGWAGIVHEDLRQRRPGRSSAAGRPARSLLHHAEPGLDPRSRRNRLLVRRVQARRAGPGAPHRLEAQP